jgi:ATP-dependent RNA helicase DDX3X
MPEDEAAFMAQFAQKHHAAGINFDKYNDIQVETSGRDVPEHRSSFKDLNLGRVLQRNINFNQYSKPTPVQQYAIPISIGNRDIMACAQTGD